jgi:hypothetical protein
MADLSEQTEEWASGSNEALCLRLGKYLRSESAVAAADVRCSPAVRALDDTDALHGEDQAAIKTFHPTFTYPIFGEKEKIHGYQDLEIRVCPLEGGKGNTLRSPVLRSFPSHPAL